MGQETAKDDGLKGEGGGSRATPINRLSARVGSIRSRQPAYVAVQDPYLDAIAQDDI